MNFDVDDLQNGVILVGGSGTNVTRDLIDSIDPEQYPNLHIMCLNTDAHLLRDRFGNDKEPRQKMWMDSGRFEVHQIGKELTRGRGTGGNRESGEAAARSDSGKRISTNFLKKVSDVFIVGAAVGGTGGAIPVIAQMAVEMGKSVLVILFIPDPEEGMSVDARESLKKVMAIAPTIPILNDHVFEYIQTLEGEAKENFSSLDAWKMVNDHSASPILKILFEITQIPGDVRNFDLADWKAHLSRGRHPVIGICETAPNSASSLTPEEIVSELTKASFQDKGNVEKGTSIFLWVHGKWPSWKVSKVKSLLRSAVAKGNKHREAELFLDWGQVERVNDGKMWMAVVIMTPNSTTPEAIEEKSEIIFRSGTTEHKEWVPSALATQYKQAWQNPASVSLEEFNRICDEIQQRTKYRPNLPPSVRASIEEQEAISKSGRGGWLGGNRTH